MAPHEDIIFDPGAAGDDEFGLLDEVEPSLAEKILRMKAPQMRRPYAGLLRHIASTQDICDVLRTYHW